MKKSGVILIVISLLLWPLWVGADETTIPPEMNWTPTPPARPAIDLVHLTQLLVAKGVISAQEYAQPIQSQSPSTMQSGQARALTQDQAYHHPVLIRDERVRAHASIGTPPRLSTVHRADEINGLGGIESASIPRRCSMHSGHGAVVGSTSGLLGFDARANMLTSAASSGPPTAAMTAADEIL